MDKTQLRRKCQEARDSLDPQSRSLSSRKIWEKLEAMEEFRKAKNIACYVNFRSEVETLPFLLKHLGEKKLFVPKTHGKCIDFFSFKGLESLSIGHYGILEPKEHEAVDPGTLDLILTPGLAFTAKGARLGYGRGYYDRFFAGCDATAIGLAFEVQILEELPLDPWDHLLHGVITEERILSR